MNFIVEQNASGSWSLTPIEGVFEGRVIAQVEGASLDNVKFNGRVMIGAIKSLWGVTIVMEEIYGDPQTLRSLCLGKTFDTKPNEPVALDYDKYVDKFTRRALHGAKRLMVMGSNIFGKGLA